MALASSRLPRHLDRNHEAEVYLLTIMPLSDPQRAVLAAVAACLIPTDEHGPGANEANVARYIERALEEDYSAHFDAYATGLARLDSLAQSAYTRGFVALAPEQQAALLADVEGGEATDRAFFELVLQHTKEGMFGDPSWGGNAGFVGWKLIGYPGPRHVWTAEDQRLDVVIAPTYEDDAPDEHAAP